MHKNHLVSPKIKKQPSYGGCQIKGCIYFHESRLPDSTASFKPMFTV